LDALTRALVESVVAVFNPPDPVLEIGSLQVQEGAVGDLRAIFAGRQFVGCDMQAGPGVDRVERLEALTLPDGWAGTVLCLNVFEHAWDFHRGAAEILRVTRPGGLALITAPFEFHIHAYPDDYWRFTPQALARLMGGFESVIGGWQGHPKTPRLVFALGLRSRPADLAALAAAWKRETFDRWQEYPPLWDRFRAAVGGTLFGKRGFRGVRHWRDLAIEVAERA
jgi:SAM-dependent methyltransferase